MFEAYDLTHPKSAYEAFLFTLPAAVKVTFGLDRRFNENVSDVFNDPLYVHGFFQDAKSTISRVSQTIREARKSRVGFDSYAASSSLDSAIETVANAFDGTLRAMFIPGLEPKEIFQKYKTANEMLGVYYNALRKYDELHGTEASKQLAYLEAYKREFRQAVASILVPHDPQPSKKFWQVFGKPRRPRGRTYEYFERMLYNEIADANISKRNAVEDDLANVTTWGVVNAPETAESYERNCAHVAPATLATMYGAKARASARYVDYGAGYGSVGPIAAFPDVYKSHWQQVNSLDHLFDTIDSDRWPDETFAFVYFSYVGKESAHITVAGKVGGRACIIEGQTQSVITRDAPGEFRRVEKDRTANQVSFGFLDPKRLDNVQFLYARPATLETEIDRSKRAWNAMYPHRQVKESSLIDDDQTVELPPRSFDPFRPPEDTPPSGIVLPPVANSGQSPAPGSRGLG